MGRKNKRDRQARLTRKRSKRATSRAAHKSSGSSGSPPTETRAWSPPEDLATLACVLCCGALLSGAPLSEGTLEAARKAGGGPEGIASRIPFELEGFLYRGREWTITCSELRSVREAFESYGASEVYERLFILSLTNEPDPAAFASYETTDCVHRAALGFEQLRACLDDRKIRPGRALRVITAEINKRSPPQMRLARTYEELLHTAINAVQAAGAERVTLLRSLAVQCQKTFELGAHSQSDSAWWHCGRVFLTEVLTRLEGEEALRKAPACVDLIRTLLPAPQAAAEMARVTGSAETLRRIHFPGVATLWRTYLESEIDVGKLPYEDRIRYEIAQVRLLRAAAQPVEDDDEEDEDRSDISAFLKAFESLQGMLAHGVPPQSAAVPGFLVQPLIEFYVEAVQELRAERLALRTTQQMLVRSPEDFRLACVYGTGVIRLGDHKKLSFLKPAARQHVDPELFARCVLTWSAVPRGMKAAAVLRHTLFDPLDREHRKQCLIALSRQYLRRAASVKDYNQQLHSLQPFFERDSFVYRDLRERAAVESSLVFLATMMAPIHNVELSLTEDQSQQWVSHAHEISRQSPLGAELSARYLKTPSRWFKLAPAVRERALAQLVGAGTAPARSAPPARGKPGPKSRKRKKIQDGPTQPDLF